MVSLGLRRDASRRFHGEGALSVDEVGVTGDELKLDRATDAEGTLDIVKGRLKDVVAEMGGVVSPKFASKASLRVQRSEMEGFLGKERSRTSKRVD